MWLSILEASSKPYVYLFIDLISHFELVGGLKDSRCSSNSYM